MHVVGFHFRHEQNQHPGNEANGGTGNEADVYGNDEHTDADVEEKKDFVHNYHSPTMTFGLPMMFFSDSVRG